MSEGKKVESRRKDRTAINVGGNWFPCTTAVGEFVSNGDIITIEEYGPEKNDRGEKIIKKVKMLEKAQRGGNNGGGKPSGSQGGGSYKGGDADRQGSIIRQSCMGYASTIVAATLTGKSNPKEAAQLVVEIADTILVPYATSGQKPGEKQSEVPVTKETPAAKSEPQQGVSEDDPEEPPF